MKKITFIITGLLFSTITFAQTKGDSYISGTISAEFGTQETEVSNGSLSDSESQPLTTSFDIGVEYGYFVTDNFRLSIGAYVPFTKTPLSKENGEWLNSSTIGFGINPNIAYYVRITDKLYYTPEIGGYYEFGDYEQDLSSSKSYKTDYTGWSAYLSFLSLEYRVYKNFAIGANIGGINYSSVEMNDKDSGTDISISQFKFNLNKAEINVRMYF